MTEKYEFTDRGFCLVADKVGEADYFLEMMKSKTGYVEELKYLLSAFVSATRSITFALQAVMSGCPSFQEWYKSRQECLKESRLARFFVELRNHSQKVGSIPLYHSGYMADGFIQYNTEFFPTSDIKEVPIGNIISLSSEYFCLVLHILKEAYRDYRVYVDPRAIFTIDGLNELGWSIEDLEESLGFPRGWTDVESDGPKNDEDRLRVLSRYGGDEFMEKYFDKYEI